MKELQVRTASCYCCWVANLQYLVARMPAVKIQICCRIIITITKPWFLLQKYNAITWLSHDCIHVPQIHYTYHMAITWLSHVYHMTITWLPQPTVLEHAVAIIMSLGLNWQQWVGPGWPPSKTATFSPVSASQTCTAPSCEPGVYGWVRRGITDRSVYLCVKAITNYAGFPSTSEETKELDPLMIPEVLNFKPTHAVDQMSQVRIPPVVLQEECVLYSSSPTSK